MKNNLKIIIFIIILALVGFAFKQKQPAVVPTPQDELEIISTTPHPLEEATILPTQSIEVTFNKPLFVSEFKHKFDPEIEHQVEAINSQSTNFGQTLRIVFTKPLQLGSGYTLFILPNTHSEDGLKLGRDVIYHFKTIDYRGV
ncbi:hypothetical protein HY386_01475 [Candidatus Daviesbacteria bacterium]|nr:hypothetical protein [Candidatus Daviesbacteria bacterium]